MTKEQEKKNEAIAGLRDLLKPGDTVYTQLVHCARSGMYRTIDLYLIRNNEPLRITWGACQAIGARYDRNHEAMGMSGCGMDMGFAAVYNLSYVLFPEGHECIGKGCPSNDHSNGDRDYTSGAGHMHRDGGYALRHGWL